MNDLLYLEQLLHLLSEINKEYVILDIEGDRSLKIHKNYLNDLYLNNFSFLIENKEMILEFQ